MKKKRIALKQDEVVVPLRTIESIVTLMQTSVAAVNAFGGYFLTMLTTLESAQPENQELRAFRKQVEEVLGNVKETDAESAPLLESLRVLTIARRTETPRRVM